MQRAFEKVTFVARKHEIFILTIYNLGKCA